MHGAGEVKKNLWHVFIYFLEDLGWVSLPNLFFLLFQKSSLFNLGVHISPQFCEISDFLCNF